jgi:hypothetical protein
MPEMRGSAEQRRIVAERGEQILKLNREGLVNLRRVLYAAGKHPPRCATFFLSFLRKQESESVPLNQWIAAFAGMTEKS